jgi:hypothetical protein
VRDGTIVFLTLGADAEPVTREDYASGMVTQYRTVQEYLEAQPDDRRVLVEEFRALVLEANPAVVEHIKWNSPSYLLDGVDQATVNAQGKQGVRLVLHRGATTAENRDAASAFTGDPHGLLTWHSDIRASLPVANLADLAAKRPAAVAVLRAWLAPAGSSA